MKARSTETKPSIVLCHGIWADGSCFSKVIPTLQAEGHQVIAAQYGLDTLAGDVATVRRTLVRVRSPAILVGHSYGGSVITAAGTDERVAGLVYIAALAPDADETSQSQLEKFPVTDVFAHVEVADGRVWMLPDGVEFRRRLVRAGQESRLGNSLCAGSGPVHTEARRCRVEVEAQFVHRGHERPHGPTRDATVRRQAHGRQHDGGRQQPRSHALQSQVGDRCDSCRRKGRCMNPWRHRIAHVSSAEVAGV